MTQLIRDRYEPIEVVGEGGEGRLVKALDRQHGRFVALKLRTVASDADRELMLFGDTLPGIEGKNPMKDLLAWDDFSDDPRFPRPRQVRTVCCANYVVPGRNPRYCRTCGLVSQEQRREYWDRFANDRDTATAVPWPPRG